MTILAEILPVFSARIENGAMVVSARIENGGGMFVSARIANGGMVVSAMLFATSFSLFFRKVISLPILFRDSFSGVLF